MAFIQSMHTHLSTHFSHPLGPYEFNVVDAFLKSWAAEFLDSQMVDGYLAGLACGPKPMLKDDKLTWVGRLGDDTGHLYDGRFVPEVLMHLLRRHFDHIKKELSSPKQTYMPRINAGIYGKEGPENGLPILDAQTWCFGFQKAIDEVWTDWQPLITARPDLFWPMQYQMQVMSPDIPFDLGRFNAAASSLASMVNEAHAYWNTSRTRLRPV